jgi:hypothetical protein
MKSRFLPLCLVLAASTWPVYGQSVSGGGPRSLDRDAIPGGSAGAEIKRPPAPVRRATTYITLSPERIWKNQEGKEVTGKLIAHEDIVVEVAPGQEAVAAKPAGRPTVIKDGKVRLLVAKRPTAVALDQLSSGDQEEIRRIEKSISPSTAPNPAGSQPEP